MQQLPLIQINKDIPDISYYSSFINQREAKEYFSYLYTAIPWEQDTYNFGGKEIMIPRLTAWYGNMVYKYAGLEKKVREFDATVYHLLKRVEETRHGEFNSVLLNLYRSGEDSVSWHSDDEPELGINPVIASISLGHPRIFEFKHRTLKRNGYKILLEDGSLLIMRGDTQHRYRHRIPKEPHVTKPRINLTFRLMKGSINEI